MVTPIVLIMFGARDEAETLPKFLQQLDNLEYPREKLRYAVTTSPSKDNTVDIILDWLKTKKDTYWRHIDLSHIGNIRKRMFTATNYIRHYAAAQLPNVDSVDYVFHCDADIEYIPPETLNQLIGLGVDIVAPYVYNSSENNPYNKFRNQHIFRDVWGYRFKYGPYPGLTFNDSVADYYKRNYLTDDSIQADKGKHLIPMQSVGANPVLIKRHVIDHLLPLYDGLHATPGWCILADELGYGVWSYPLLECIHTWRKNI